MLETGEKLDPRVKRTRGLLQQALVELVQEKPFDRITVQEIAARAEVNRATFYAHFEDKYALLNNSLRDAFQERLEEKVSCEQELTADNLRLLIATTCDFLGEFMQHCAPVHVISEQARMFIHLQVHLHEMMTVWLKHSGQTDTLMNDTAAMTSSWAIWGTVFRWARGGRKIPAEQLTDQILTLLMPGLNAYLVDGA